MQEESRLIQFLMKLSPDYKNVRSNILFQYHLPTISHAYRLLTQEERHTEVYQATHAEDDGGAFIANKRRPPGSGPRAPSNNRFLVGGNQIVRSSNTQSPYTRRSNLYCDHYKIKVHTKDNCWKIHEYPSDFKDKWKGKRVAAAASGLNESEKHASGVQAAPAISLEQYNKLMTF